MREQARRRHLLHRHPPPGRLGESGKQLGVVMVGKGLELLAGKLAIGERGEQFPFGRFLRVKSLLNFAQIGRQGPLHWLQGFALREQVVIVERIFNGTDQLV